MWSDDGHMTPRKGITGRLTMGRWERGQQLRLVILGWFQWPDATVHSGRYGSGIGCYG
jgi:hypothetical protein